MKIKELKEMLKDLDDNCEIEFATNGDPEKLYIQHFKCLLHNKTTDTYLIAISYVDSDDALFFQSPIKL